MCFKYCDAFPKLFALVDDEARRRRPRADATARPRRSWTTASSASCARSAARTRRATTTRSQLDFPKLVAPPPGAAGARARARRCASASSANPDAVGLAARLGRRPRQPAEPQHRAPPVAREDAGHPPRQAAAGVRAANVRGVGGRREADRARARRRGRAVPDLLRRQQRAGDRPRHDRGPARERRRRPLRARPRLLRDAGLGVRRSRGGPPARPPEPRPAGAARRGGQHRRRAGSDVRPHAAARVPDAGRPRRPGTRAQAGRGRTRSVRAAGGRSTGSRGRPPRWRRGPKASPITWPATSARRRSAFRPATSCGARASRASSPSENAAATTAATR